jgi:tetratricopeptide (TPR) repeat protein
MTSKREPSGDGDRGDLVPGYHNKVAASEIGGAVIQAHTIAGGIHQQAAYQPPPPPRQLPPAPRGFTGRTAELAALTSVLNDPEQGSTVVISAIGGTGGIGKTCLALHWAHEHTDRFPDGQLYVNLRGYDPLGPPLSSGAAVRGFLDALGVDPAGFPPDLDAQVGRYRSMVDGRRLLIVLDNARDADQMEALLPGSPTCMVIVTSRRRLTGLASRCGAHLLDLDVLSDPDARELLASQLGSARLATEPDATRELLAFSAGLPLALSIVAARVRHHPNFPLVVLAEELREEPARLAAFDAGDLHANLRAVLFWSYRALNTDCAHVFRLLGLAPGPDISLPAAAALTAFSMARARVVLLELEHAFLVQQQVPGRYRMHDLVGLYAAEQAHQILPTDVTQAALQRLLEFFLHTALRADRLLDPHREPIEVAPPVLGDPPLPLLDIAEAREWLDAEYACLTAAEELAAARHRHSFVWQFAWALTTFRIFRGHIHDHIVAWQAGLVAATDRTVQIFAHQGLGWAYSVLERPAEALDQLHQALALASDMGNRRCLADIHLSLASAGGKRGNGEDALEYNGQAVRLYRALGDPVGEADALNSMGWHLTRLGRHNEADGPLREALCLIQRNHNPNREAEILDSLAYLAHHSGHHAAALDRYHQALALYRELGNIYQAAHTLDHLGHTYVALGRHREARCAWQQSQDLHRAQRNTVLVEGIQQLLDTLDQQANIQWGCSAGVGQPPCAQEFGYLCSRIRTLTVAAITEPRPDRPTG